MKPKKINWVESSTFTGVPAVEGFVGNMHVFLIKKHEGSGTYEIYSIFDPCATVFWRKFTYTNTDYVDIEGAKAYCQRELMQEIFDMFFEEEK